MHSLEGFYEASASVTGALIGLLFVAMSIAGEHDDPERSPTAHRIRAAAALTSFTNALTVSLFTLIEGQSTGSPALVVAILGLLFVLGALISLRGEPRTLRDVLFLATLVAGFIAQLIFGLRVSARPGDLDAQKTIAILVVVFLLNGIARSWELIGGPTVGIRSQLLEMVRSGRTRTPPE